MKTFSERLLILFGQPKSIDDEAFVREYERLLKSYSPEIIDDAIDRLARSHKYPGWPKIADCVAAAEDAIEARNWKLRAQNGGDRPESDAVKAAHIAAAKFVNGVGGNGWEWAPEFRSHHLVVLAESEGWGRDLRAACKRDAFLRFLVNDPRDVPTVERVMPKNADDIAYWRDQARREREATEWRKNNPDNKAIKNLEQIDVRKLINANRDAFRAMQMASRNRGMHRARNVTGERDG
jgi:hypothetical protein